jgi:hypothetical protein
MKNYSKIKGNITFLCADGYFVHLESEVNKDFIICSLLNLAANVQSVLTNDNKSIFIIKQRPSLSFTKLFSMITDRYSDYYSSCYIEEMLKNLEN